MFGKISKEEKEEAICYLIDHIPKDCLKKVSIAVQNNGYCWSVDMCFGMYVRNTLRKGGFHWGPCALDDLWSPLVEEAARRTEPTKANNS